MSPRCRRRRKTLQAGRRAAVLFLLAAGMLRAQTSPFTAGGYVKYLFSVTDAQAPDRRLDDHLVHARLNTRWYPTENLSAALEVRVLAFYGGSVRYLPGYAELVRTDYPFHRLDLELWNMDWSLGYAQIDRLFLDYTRGPVQVTAGRQRVAWGTCLVWNTVDIFNPQSVLDFDYEEKPGADALRVQYYPGPVSTVEAAWQPDTAAGRHTAAAQWSVNLAGYDLFLMTAFKDKRRMVGGAWSGYIKGGGFRGEVRIADPPADGPAAAYPVPPFYGSNLTAAEKTDVSAVLSGDYTFSNTLYLHVEGLYNRNGKTRYAGLFWSQAAPAGMLSPSRWSTYLECAGDITPLVRGTAFTMYDPSDGSFLYAGSVVWSATENLELTGTGYWTKGGNLTQFGALDRTAAVRLKYSF